MTLLHSLYKLLENCPQLSWRVDFQTRSLVLDRRHVIRDGVLVPALSDYTVGCPDVPMSLPDTEQHIAQLYHAFRHSIADHNERRHVSSYFSALRYDELSDYDRINGADRNLSRFMLECSVLMLLLDGHLGHWPDEWSAIAHRHFHAITGEPQCIIRREWIEPNYKQY